MYGAYLCTLDWDGPVYSKDRNDAFKFNSQEEADKYHTHDLVIYSAKYNVYDCNHKHFTVTQNRKGQFTAKCLDCGATTDRPKSSELFAEDWLLHHPTVGELRS